MSIAPVPASARPTTAPVAKEPVGLKMSKAPDGSVKVPDLGVSPKPETTQRFSFDVPMMNREHVPVVKAAIDGVAKLTDTKISTDIKRIGFRNGDNMFSGKVSGSTEGVAAAIKAIDDIAMQVT